MKTWEKMEALPLEEEKEERERRVLGNWCSPLLRGGGSRDWTNHRVEAEAEAEAISISEIEQKWASVTVQKRSQGQGELGLSGLGGALGWA